MPATTQDLFNFLEAIKLACQDDYPERFFFPPPDLDETGIPGHDTHFPEHHARRLNIPALIQNRAAHIASEALGGKPCQLTGRFHYPPGGFMGWHTNSNNPGRRVYATHADVGGKSFFRYKGKNGIVTDWDKQGWQIRLFEIKADELFWHCVYSGTNRYSFGFLFKE